MRSARRRPPSAPREHVGCSVRLVDLTIDVGQGRATRTLLAGVDEVFTPGTVTAIVGRSGSGKTTLLKAIGGSAPFAAGDIVVGETSLADMTESQRRELRRTIVTTIFQDLNLIDVLTARENVLLGMEISRSGTPDRLLDVDRLLDRLGIADVANEYPATLSGGEQQRAAIARSLASRHSVILADEPTGALDSSNGAMVMDQIRLLAKAGSCCIVATHDPDVSKRADRVLRIRDGQLA